MRAIRRFTVRPLLPESLEGLAVLARNLRWSWHPETQDVFAAVDPELWEASRHDPVRLLGAVSRDRLAELARDRRFTRMLELAVADLEQYLTGDRWYQHAEPAAGESPRGIGYFSPEFGITSVLPQYSGGLGILAGDHLKTASDLGVPITGVGLLYKHGYFRQSLSRDGWQQETYPVADPDGLPITPLRHADGTPATISIGVPGGTLHARIWVAQVGRVPLLLLDSDIEANEGQLREVTDRLYGGAGEHRLLQELLLGVGGTRAIGVHSEITGAPYPEVFHTNEGHAGFLGLERIRLLSVAEGSPGLSLEAARELSRAGTVFTTHTPVPAGIDRFPVDLVRQYFGAGRDGSDGPVPGLPVDWVLALGAEDYPGGDPGVFNMAVMGFRLAQRANGVSLLHGEVSRGMFNGLWPNFDATDVPIGSITNGVHAPTWVAREVFELAAKAGGDADDESVFDVVDQIPATDLWATKRVLRQRLVDDARRRLRDSWLERGAAPAELGWIDEALSPDVLTIGFARRVPSYKRLTLMLRDPERLKRLLLHPERPIQLVIAGKSHPADDGGKSLIQQMVRFADDPEVRHRIVFLPNYDIAMAQPLYPGCDVWLNNPLRPYEACGTSGMKAALNGGLNLSILDGWWDEWYDGQNGWAIPSAEGPDSGPELDNGHRDDVEATALYDLVENHVAPRFYDIGRDGVPDRWLAMVRHTLKSLGPKVLATRMVRDYVQQLYTPAAQTARLLDGDFTGANELAAWKGKVGSAWPSVAVEHVEAADLPDAPELGSTMSVRAFVALGALAPSDVVVQLVHGGISSTDELTGAVSEPLGLAESYDGGRHRFEGTVTLDRTGPFGYTVRVLPTHPHLAGPSELGLVALPS